VALSKTNSGECAISAVRFTLGIASWSFLVAFKPRAGVHRRFVAQRCFSPSLWIAAASRASQYDSTP